MRSIQFVLWKHKGLKKTSSYIIKQYETTDMTSEMFLQPQTIRATTDPILQKIAEQIDVNHDPTRRDPNWSDPRMDPAHFTLPQTEAHVDKSPQWQKPLV